MSMSIENVKDPNEAARFIESVLHGATLDLEEESAAIAEIDNATSHLPFGVPKPLWLGVRDDNQRLVAALHASAPFGQALQINREEPNPNWIALYVNQNLLIHEVAVDQQFQRQGLAAALGKRAHSRALATTDHPAEYFVTSFATSDHSIALAKSQGYIIGDPAQPVPPEYAGGLGSLANPPALDAFRLGRWAWQRLDRLPRG